MASLFYIFDCNFFVVFVFYRDAFYVLRRGKKGFINLTSRRFRRYSDSIQGIGSMAREFFSYPQAAIP